MPIRGDSASIGLGRAEVCLPPTLFGSRFSRVENVHKRYSRVYSRLTPVFVSIQDSLATYPPF